MPGKVILEVTAGPIKGQSYIFDEHDTFIFGREDDCHAKLAEADTTASRHHFILEVNPPDARIRDLGSLNGTRVNETKYGGRPGHMSPEEALRLRHPDVDLKDADEIRIGETVFKVKVDAPAVCAECDTDIPLKFKRACQWVNGLYICPDCREKVDVHGLSTKLVQAPRCEKCGEDVSAELKGRIGDYLCEVCHEVAEANPAAILQTMLETVRANDKYVSDNIDNYEFGKELGIGGMGAVYLARRKRDGLTVAIKVMLAKVAVDEYSRRGFQREIDVTSNLRHPNIVELFEHGSSGSAFYFTLEYCPGGSVWDKMESERRTLSIAESGNIMLHTLNGLAYAHEKGFVHRDIKPQNILLTAQTNGIAKVSDFGLAKNFQKAGLSGMTATGTFAGSFHFMPREQLTNFKGSKPVSDVWSTAATLYFMLTRKSPRDFPSDPKKATEVVMHGEVIPIRQRVSSIPERLANVIDRALLNDIKSRYQSAAEFHDALSKVL